MADAASRRLGADGPLVSALGLGLLGLSGGYGNVPGDEQRFEILDHAFELGCRFWDTANIYADSEDLIKKWFDRTGKRSEIFLATKFGMVMDKFTFKGIDSSAEYCKQCCEKSLERLGVDRIDLFYAHRVNPATPIEATMRAMLELKDAGKISHIGFSEISSTALRRACALGRVAAVQLEYSLFVKEIEGSISSNILQTCRELGVAVVCYSPLGRGLLTNTLTNAASVNGAGDLRGKMLPWFHADNFDANAQLMKRLQALADQKGCTTAQLALAWLLAQGNDIIPIPGTKRIERLEENIGALELCLSEQELQDLRSFTEVNEISGYRSTEQSKDFAYTDTVPEIA